MTDKDYIFNLIEKSKFINKIKQTAGICDNITPPIKGEFLEHLIVDSIYPVIKDFSSGSTKEQIDFSIDYPKENKSIRVSMKTGKVVGVKSPKLEFNGSFMSKFNNMAERIDYMNNKNIVDGILSCILIKKDSEVGYNRCELRYFSPKIFGKYKECDFVQNGVELHHTNKHNGILTVMKPKMGYKLWYKIPVPLLENHKLIINF